MTWSTANELVRPLHERMPVILPIQDFDRWLDHANQSAEGLDSLLRPYPAEVMEAYPVDARVNHLRFEDPACLLKDPGVRKPPGFPR